MVDSADAPLPDVTAIRVWVHRKWLGASSEPRWVFGNAGSISLGKICKNQELLRPTAVVGYATTFRFKLWNKLVP